MAEALGVAGSVVGIVSFGIQITQGLLRYYGSWKDQDSDVATMCTSLNRLSESLKILHKTIRPPAVFEQDSRDCVEKSVTEVEDTIRTLDDELAKVRNTELSEAGVRSVMRRHVRRAFYPFKEGTLNKIQRAVADARQNLGLVLDILQINVVSEVHQEVHKLVRWQEDNSTKTILHWLSAKNFWLRQSDVANRRQDGTGIWLLQNSDFLEWAEGVKDTIWCRGGPGVGKTMLMSAVIEYLETDLPPQDTTLAFVYCDHKDNQVQTVQFFIGAIVRQLVERKPEIPDNVKTLYEKHRGKDTSPTLAEQADLLRSLGKKYSEVYIVVDALDECIDGGGRFIWSDLLTSLQAAIPNLRLLCTSRDIHDTMGVFKSSSIIPIRASEADIRTYVEGQLRSKSDLLQFCNEDPFLHSEILESIVSKFLTARLHLESLTSRTNRRAVRKAIQKLPDTLDGNYDDAIERIKKQPTAKLALRVLVWMVYAPRPLELEEIQHAIAVDELEPDDQDISEDMLTPPSILINSCAGLVKVEKESNIIGLVHKTTQEYFDRNGLRHFPRAQKDIMQACFRYLSLPIFGSGACVEFEIYEQRLEDYRLLQYAAHNLAHYIIKMDDSSQHDAVCKFLLDKCRLDSTSQAMFLEPTVRKWNWKYHWHDEFGSAHYASYFGLRDILHLLIETYQVNPDSKDSYGMTPLGWAAKNGHEAIVQLLLEKGADIEARGGIFSQTPLSWAAEKGREAVVQLLLEKGADIDAKDKYSLIPLLLAARFGHEAVVQLLLEKGADIEARGGIFSQTPLGYAAENGHEAVVQLLLEKGADIDARDKYSQIPLLLAAKNGHEAIVQLLLEKGADIEARDSICSQTPLIWAAKNGHEAVVQLLLEKGKE